MNWKLVWKYTLIVILAVNVAVIPLAFIKGLLDGMKVSVNETAYTILIWLATLAAISIVMAFMANSLDNKLWKNLSATAVFSCFFVFVLTLSFGLFDISEFVAEMVLFGAAIPIGVLARNIRSKKFNG